MKIILMIEIKKIWNTKVISVYCNIPFMILKLFISLFWCFISMKSHLQEEYIILLLFQCMFLTILQKLFGNGKDLCKRGIIPQEFFNSTTIVHFIF